MTNNKTNNIATKANKIDNKIVSFKNLLYHKKGGSYFGISTNPE